jgi:hypothetical protein
MALWIYLLLTGAGAWWWYNQNKETRLKDENILDQWTHLFPDANGKGEQVFSEIKKYIHKIDPPHVEFAEKQVKGGTIKGNEKRKMLVFSNNRVAGFRMFAGATDYGKQLIVSWYLVEEMTGLARFRRIVALHWFTAFLFLPYYLGAALIERITGKVSPENMGVFEQEELAAYGGTIHNAVTESAKNVAEELNIDFSKEDTKTRGFLNLS